MMGLDDGWICDVPGVSRNEALKAAGNGVVPQQAIAALNDMLHTNQQRNAA
jgi:DNA (cytosine-5)-methyltransferase 1